MQPPPEDKSVANFAALREQCLALGDLLLPDELWPQFEKWHQTADNVAWHRSMILLAFQRDHLAKLTSPIHRYLLTQGSVRPDVRQQYRKDLSERWMYYDDPLKRHHKSRIFRGRLAELQCAEWLETLNWAVTDLEALREGPDIVATSPELRDVAVEVKFIGTEDDDFEAILRGLAGQSTARFASAYSGVNYLLFRIYEGAKQLAQSDSAKQRMVVAIVDALGWEGFELQLENEWINWKEPKFLGADPRWETFLDSQRQRYPAILEELPSTIRGLDRIWIVRQSSGFTFHLEFELLHPGD